MTQLLIRGLKETQANMERILKELEGQPVARAMQAGASIIQKEAQRTAPVLTGRLQASITAQIATQGKVVTGLVGSTVTYAPFVEYGTRRMRGRRFLQNAMESKEKEAVRRVEIAVKEIIK